MVKRAEFVNGFPRFAPIDDAPLVVGKMISDKVKVPPYVAGWLISCNDLLKKWDKDGTWRTIYSEMDGVLIRRLREIKGRDPERKLPFPSFPFGMPYDHHSDYWLYFVGMNNMQRGLDDFYAKREEAFELMCELFDVTTDELKKEMRESYGWYNLRGP